MANSKINDKYIDILEGLDWCVCGYYDDGRADLEKYSPAGEDYVICVGVASLAESVREYAEDFDPDEHIEMWIEARRNGVGGVPSTRELVEDADEIQAMLNELADALEAVTI